MLRVQADADGRLDVAPPQPFGPRDTSEAWWGAVLADWRERSPASRYHFNTLGEHLGATIIIECKQCSLRREFQTNELRAFYGAKYRMVFLRYDLAACPAGKRYKDCGVRYR
jgi:hypothetical protein